MKTLYINCCVRKDSRTNLLAHRVLDHLGESFEELKIREMGLKPIDEETIRLREENVEVVSALAKQFAKADRIVIAAPYYDSSFPSLLKLYLENIYVIGVVSTYDEQGNPIGLCKGQELIYVTTAGGPFEPDYSYDYVATLSKKYFGIKKTILVATSMLDVVGFDPQEQVDKAFADYLAKE